MIIFRSKVGKPKKPVFICTWCPLSRLGRPTHQCLKNRLGVVHAKPCFTNPKNPPGRGILVKRSPDVIGPTLGPYFMTMEQSRNSFEIVSCRLIFFSLLILGIILSGEVHANATNNTTTAMPPMPDRIDGIRINFR